MEHSNPKINKFLIFSQKYFQFFSPGLKNRKKSPLKKFLYFLEMELSGSNIKNFLHLMKRKPYNTSSISGSNFSSSKNKK